MIDGRLEEDAVQAEETRSHHDQVSEIPSGLGGRGDVFVGARTDQRRFFVCVCDLLVGLTVVHFSQNRG